MTDHALARSAPIALSRARAAFPFEEGSIAFATLQQAIRNAQDPRSVIAVRLQMQGRDGSWADAAAGQLSLHDVADDAKDLMARKVELRSVGGASEKLAEVFVNVHGHAVIERALMR